ncbi:hypothetical protein ACFX12_024817 [Malus domestica]
MALQSFSGARLCEGGESQQDQSGEEHSSLRPFLYRMEARRQGGSKFPEIDVFADVYVRPGNELAKSLHAVMMEKRQLVLQEFTSQLLPETLLEYVDPLEDAGF